MKHTVVPSTIAFNTRWELPRKRNLYISAPYQKLAFSARFTDDTDFSVPHTLIDTAETAPKGIYIHSGCAFHPFTPQAYRDMFRPVKAIAERVDAMTRHFGSSTVGLHVRRTDNILSRRHSPLSLFENEIGKILASDPETRFYLASDDPDVKRHLTDRFPDAVLTAPLSADRTSLHGIIDAFTEMLVLSRCRLILGSWWNSYSEAAALIGNTPLRQLHI